MKLATFQTDKGEVLVGELRGETLVELDHNGRTYRGRGVSTDTVEAGAEAYLNAVNRIILTAGQPVSEKPTAV